MANKPLAITSIESFLPAPSGIPALTFKVKLSRNNQLQVNRLAVEAVPANGGDNEATLTPGSKTSTLIFKTLLPPTINVNWTVKLTADFDKEILKADVKGDAGATDYLFDGNIATWSIADATR